MVRMCTQSNSQENVGFSVHESSYIKKKRIACICILNPLLYYLYKLPRAAEGVFLYELQAPYHDKLMDCLLHC